MFGLFGKKKPQLPKLDDVAKYAFVATHANRLINSEDFARTSLFNRAYGRALAETVPIHIGTLIYGPTNAEDVVSVWKRAPDEYFLDLALLLAWLHAEAAFHDVDDIYPPDLRQPMYDSLMTLCGNFFRSGDRGMELCQKYRALMRGEYKSLGGGALAEGGTYCVHSDNPFLTTHLWMINESLGGPPLEMETIGPGTIVPLQAYTCELLNSSNDAYLDMARTYLRKLP